jgi:hypothetical protein
MGYPALPSWAQCNHNIPYKIEAEGLGAKAEIL